MELVPIKTCPKIKDPCRHSGYSLSLSYSNAIISKMLITVASAISFSFSHAIVSMESIAVSITITITIAIAIMAVTRLSKSWQPEINTLEELN